MVILEARDRWLRGQRRALNRVASEEQFVNRIVRQPVRVIRVRIPAGEAEDALRQQILERMPDLSWLTFVDQTARESVDQPIAALGRFQQHGTAIRARVWLIERGDEGFVVEVWKENSLWYRGVAQSKASVVGKSSCGNGFVPCGGFCVSTEIGPFGRVEDERGVGRRGESL